MNHSTRPRPAEILRGLGALLVLGALLAGVPIGLYSVGGSPIPDNLPDWSQVTATLMRPDTDNQLFLGAVRLIGWASWCLFVAATGSEAIGYLAGRSAPSLPRPARPMQLLARDLVAMVTLTFSTATALTGPAATAAVTATVTADAHPHGPQQSMTTAHHTAPSPAALPTSSPHRAEHPRQGWRTRVIERGDTLWSIARRRYGSGALYLKIFNASRNIHQPEGTPPLTRPDQIHPGQRVRLPQIHNQDVRPSPTPSTPPPIRNPAPKPNDGDTTRPPAQHRPAQATPPGGEAPRPPAVAPAPPAHEHAPHSSASPTPRTSEEDDAPFAVTLPTGSRIGLGLAAALSVALAATRLHRRRRHRPGASAALTTPEPAPPAPVSQAHKAHLDTYADRGEPIPTDADLIAHDQTAPAPDQLAVGTRDRHTIALPLPGLDLGLSGDGAPATARAIATELLARAHRDRAELIIPEPDARALFPSPDIDLTELAAALPGLALTPTLTAAITHLETEIIHRAWLLETADQPDLPGLRTDDPAEPLPTLLLITSAPEQPNGVLQTIIQLGSRYGIGGLFLGPSPTGTSLHINRHGAVTTAEGPHSATLTGALLFHLTTDDTAAMLHTIHTATGAPVPGPSTITPPPTTDTVPAPGLVPPPRPSGEDRTYPVQLQLLGAIRLHAVDGPINTGLRRAARDLLAYLALHPHGATRDQITTALWPDHTPQSATTAFNTAIGNIRKTLRATTQLREPMFIIRTTDRYQLDPHLIDVDLWHLATTLTQARQATTDTERTHALQHLTDLYAADFASDLTHHWAESHREHLRRTVTDTLTHLAQHLQQHHPDQALTALDTEPDDQTHQLLQDLQRPGRPERPGED